MKFIPVYLFILSTAIFSCAPPDPNKQIDEGVVKDSLYESQEIGWSIVIPDGWTVISKDKLESNDARGKEAIEESSGMKVDDSGLKHLISFQKDMFNIFASTSEPFEETYPGEYDENHFLVYGLIYDAFTDQGVDVDTSSGTTTIQGLKFYTFYTTIYDTDKNIILNQILYSRLINGYAFGANINYNNEEDKKVMLDAFENSTFQ